MQRPLDADPLTSPPAAGSHRPATLRARLPEWPRFSGAMVPGLLIALVALLLPGLAWAQPDQQNPAGVTQLDVAEDGTITLAVNEATGLPVVEFVKLAQRVTGKTFVYDQQELVAQNKTITFVGPVTLRPERFLDFFQTMLYIQGFAVVVRGEPGSFELVEVVSLNGPRRSEVTAGARFVPFEELEEYRNQTGVQIQTTVPFKHINATSAAAQTRPFFAAQATQGSQLLNAPLGDDGRALLLQGFAPQVYQAARLLQIADVPPLDPEYEYRIVELEYATAEELEQILTQLLEERQNQVRPGAGAAGGQIARGSTGQVRVLANPGNNSLVIAGDPNRVLEALDLIARLDVPVEVNTSDIQVIELKNVLAEDLETTLRDFLNRDRDAQREQNRAGGNANAIQQQTRQTVIVAHPESNSLLVSGTQSSLKRLERMITNLDRRQPQVLVEAALVELSTNDSDTLGVELGALDLGGDEFTRPFGFTSFGLTSFSDTDGDGLPDTRLPPIDSPATGFTGGIISSEDFAIPLVVNALASTQRANILSLPSVVVNNNQTAVVRTEENRPTQTAVQGTATTQTAVGDPRSAGITLSISPSISTNDYLRLNVDLQVSRFTDDPDPVTGGVTLIRQIRTQVSLPSGSTMVIGGVIEDTETESESGIPFLKDIPILGLLFSTSGSTQTKLNLYFFVTPTILDEPDFSDLRELSQATKQEAAEYIGNRRLKIVDPLWTGPREPRLDDSETSADDLGRQAGFETPFVRESDRTIDPATIDGTIPIGPGPDDPVESGIQLPGPPGPTNGPGAADPGTNPGPAGPSTNGGNN